MDYDIPNFLDGKLNDFRKGGFKPLNEWYKGKTRSEILSIATPKWADRKEIKKLYKYAQLLSLQTNSRYEVDHIIPLKSNTVCGLHIIGNLRVVLRSDNRSLKHEFQQTVGN